MMLKWAFQTASTVVQLQTEGLSGIEDLADFDKETIEGIASNL